jgi:acyl-CoA synthetase (AMP-forming)/AMP-acid ligase II
MMLQQRDLIGNHDYSAVRLCTMGGAPASDVLIDSVGETFKQAEIVTIYGTTETSASLFGPHPEGKERPRHSVGWPVKGNEFKLMDGESEDFGTLYVKGPGLMNGYYNNPTEMARRLKDGFFDTGDVLRRDAEGWYYFVGRADDMFVCSGNNIYPGDVELMLERHDDIDQAIVVPVPDEIKHRIPYAFIVKRVGSGLDEKAVQKYALDNAPPYQYPRRVVFVDALPLNGVGKIDRKVLEARAKEMSETAAKTSIDA